MTDFRPDMELTQEQKYKFESINSQREGLVNLRYNELKAMKKAYADVENGAALYAEEVAALDKRFDRMDEMLENEMHDLMDKIIKENTQ